MTKAVVLLSGGMDSATALAIAAKDCDEVVAVGFAYGSKHMLQETAAAGQLATYYEIRREEINVPHDIFGGAGSVLLGEGEMPHLTYRELSASEGPSPTVVPFRNPVMISMAVARAIVHNADFVYVGVHAEDAHNSAYPDCTFECMGPLGAAIYAGSYQKIRLVTPFQWMTKADIVYMAYRLRVPLHLTWSCYDPVLVQKADPSVGLWDAYAACGRCPTCIERIAAFVTNSMVDPIDYAIDIEWPGNAMRYPVFTPIHRKAL